ncbi:50S ribosomal protein L6 [Coprobacillus sp. CAG:826]|nr:50S ribosomal protein L6 [Coprobacillus sp.]CDD92564.1 50S ribosomal protein L6 [Coprobacillus sp. CAG:826]
MSRIGHKVIHIPAGTTVEVNGNTIVAKGPKGTETETFDPRFTYEINGDELRVIRPNDEKQTKALHGTTRALLHNMIVGVTEGFKKELVIVGIGYRAQMKGTDLNLFIGYSHDVLITPEHGVKITCPSATEVTVEGTNRQAVGQTAARIRAVREPEPYKGKGIMYKNEHIIRKEGKRAGKK